MRRIGIGWVVVFGLAAAARAGGPELHGFVDASVVHDFTLERGEFGLDQVELDLTHEPGDRTSLRADLEWVKEGEAYSVAVEQACVAYRPGGDWALTFGRFNAPIGFELLDAPDMYQYSHALVFTYALPSNLTGLMVGRPIAPGLDAAVYAVNGWDQNAESNKLRTGGGRIGFKRGAFAGGLSLIAGREGGAEEPEFDRGVVDLDLACTPAGWVLGAELNAGRYESDGGSEERWWGGLLMAHRELTPWAGLTIRYDYLDDQDARLFGRVAGEAQVRQALALAPTFTLDEGLGALIEVRMDASDREAFVDGDGDPRMTQWFVAGEVTCSW